MKKLLALSWCLLLAGTVCLFHDARAQLSQTGAGLGTPTAPAAGVTVDTLSWASVSSGTLASSGCGATGAAFSSFHLTWTHPGAASGVTAAIIIFNNFTNGGGGPINAITYGGTSMTSAGTAIGLANSTQSLVGLWGLGGAASGSQTVDVNFNNGASSFGRIGLMTVKGSVTTSNPFLAASYNTNSGTSATSSSLTISSEANDLVVDAIENYDGTNQYAMTPGGGQTLEFFGEQACTGSTALGTIGGSVKAGSASQSMSWSWSTSSDWATAGASIKHQ